MPVRSVVTRAVALGFISCGLVLVSSEQTTVREGPASESSATTLGRDLAAVAISREARAVSQVLKVPASKGERHSRATEEQRPGPGAGAPALTASAAERPRRPSGVPGNEASRASTGKGGRVLVAGIKAFCGRNWGSEMSNYARRSPGPNRLMVASVPPRSSVHVFPISNPSKERTRRSTGHCRLGLTNLREMLPMRRTTS